ncbi:MAG TPA: cytochrome C oxidase subunit IV family protein [Dongiaceae bacterium]|jgi:cytochrome c oxidase subunit 4
MASVRAIIGVWLALMLLLAVTVGASFATTGLVSAGVSLGIAFCKAALVLWFFMNLRAENGLIRIAAVGAAIWLLILLLLSATDFAARGLT